MVLAARPLRVCLLPIDFGVTATGRIPEAEVDHVEPLAGGGSRTLDNLLITHRACNQSKKAKPLDRARRDLGITPHDITVRLLALPIERWAMFRPTQIAETSRAVSVGEDPRLFDF